MGIDKINLDETIAIYIDFDGVILDTEKRVKQYMMENNLRWKEGVKNIDWKRLLIESKEINNSLEILSLVQRERKKIYILTKTHSIPEGVEKVKYLRNKGILIPILFSHSGIKKSQIIVPNNESLLVDDNLENLTDWVEQGGRGIYFSDSNEVSDYPKAYDLEFLKK